ncbi:uncharacterized protein [Littorina saxatilis]|uniref:Uncharacterized protein n=1 Tax=Littorina saxatilis TaxID=31220 RepID=A0AAN9GGL9_9CAEN
MAVMEDPRKRAAEAKKIRIDHSDVYLDNDKLTEELGYSLNHLSKKRHRQAANLDMEIRQIRRNLSSMNFTKSAVSALTSLRPITAPSLRRLKPPPVIVKLDVRVPDKDDNSDVSDEKDEDEKCSEEEKRLKGRWKQHQMRMNSAVMPAGGAGGRTRGREAGGEGERPSGEVSPKQVRKTSKERLVLHNLDMDAIPPSWFTDVHHPPDIPLPRRASSAHPSSRLSHLSAPRHAPISPTTFTTRPTSLTTRPKSETAKFLPRRPKTAVPSATMFDDYSDSALVCGQQQPQKTETKLRSRRELIELTGRGGRGIGEAGEGSGGTSQFLDAVRLERERLDVKVKMFLQSCDGVGEAGISSKERQYYNTLMPHRSVYG